MDNRKIVCANNNGMVVNFSDKFLPFLLADADGLYGINFKVNMPDNTMTDGATYQSSTAKKRNIVLTLKTKANHRLGRYELYQLFPQDMAGTLTYIEDGVERKIDYIVESVTPDSEKNVRTATVSLLCPSPFFKAASETTLTMAGWEADFEFIHEFLEEGESFGHRVKERLKVIESTSGAKYIPIKVEIYANGGVTNPTVTHVETGDFIKVGNTAHTLNMTAGDLLVITTGTNDKRVRLTHEGVTAEINEYLDEDSEFIQLQPGTNTIGYSAEAGDSNMTVSLSYTETYPGA